MFVKSLKAKAVGIAALAACVFAAIIALACAIYFGLTIYFVPAGAAALTSLIFALVAIGIGLATSKPEPDDEEDLASTLVERGYTMVKDRPILSSIAGLGLAWILLRNPTILGLAATALTTKSLGGSGR